MRVTMRRVLGLVAIYTIALHTILSGVAPVFAGPAADPFSVICHSGGVAAAEQSPAEQTPAPQQVCDHCTLCSAAPAPSAALDATLATTLTPVKLLQVLRPAPALPRDGIAFSPHLARGPPQLT